MRNRLAPRVKSVRRILGPLTLVIMCLSGPTPQSFGEPAPMRPVLLLNTNGGVSEEVSARVVEQLTGAMREAVLRVYARQMYGTGKGFRSKPKSGPIGLVADVFYYFDLSLERRAREELADDLGKLSRDQPFNFTINLIWVKDRESLNSISKDLPGVHGLSLLWEMAKSAAFKAGADGVEGAETTAKAMDLITEIATIPMIDESTIPGGAQSLYNQGMATLEWLREVARDKTVPVNLKFGFEAYQDFVHVETRVVAKPAVSQVELDPPFPQDTFAATHLHWKPPHFAADPPLARFRFSRYYGKRVEPNAPILSTTFGRIVANDVREVAFCNMNCIEEDRAGQRHIFKSAPTIPGKLRLPDTITGAKRRALEPVIKFVNKHMDLYVLLNDLHFDFTNPRNLRLIESKSRIPLIVRVGTAIDNRHYFDITKNRYGIDYFERLVNSRAAFKMSLAYKNRLKDVNDMANQQMTELVTKVREFLK